MRLAIFGGSFDPPHIGHLLAASDAFEQLSLDRIFLVPAANQPLKAGRANAPTEHRLEMARLLVAGDPRFDVSNVEVERGGLSFTVDTLMHFAMLYPKAERFLLVGADVLSSFGQWREPRRILELARLVLLERQAGAPVAVPSALGGPEVQRLATRRIDVSSTEIRERVRTGKPIRGFVTDAVAAYIERAALYRES
ncbi:MAG: nicotinate-nucleotide adenylyltransferase [Gemmatimonadaceae bacterium]